MKKLVGLLTALVFASVVLSALPVSAGVPYCWFNKWISTDGGNTWLVQKMPADDPVVLRTRVGEDVTWLMRITIALPTWVPGDVYDVIVRDRFGAEWEIASSLEASKGTAGYYTKGRSEKVFLVWLIGSMSPGETVTLEFAISTDLNPAGNQEYTSPGCYELNSGAVFKCTFRGKQYSAYTLPIYVSVEE